jgi:hypothetical protein
MTLPPPSQHRLGVDTWIDHGRQLEDLHRGCSTSIGASQIAMFLLTRNWSSMLC